MFLSVELLETGLELGNGEVEFCFGLLSGFGIASRVLLITFCLLIWFSLFLFMSSSFRFCRW